MSWVSRRKIGCLKYSYRSELSQQKVKSHGARRAIFQRTIYGIALQFRTMFTYCSCFPAASFPPENVQREHAPIPRFYFVCSPKEIVKKIKDPSQRNVMLHQSRECHEFSPRWRRSIEMCEHSFSQGTRSVRHTRKARSSLWVVSSQCSG